MEAARGPGLARWERSDLTPLELYALQYLAERYSFRLVQGGDEGLSVVELVPR
ncbi:MAG: hypothetical protein U0R26_10725 [Solirubrobacterales bacterium]